MVCIIERVFDIIEIIHAPATKKEKSLNAALIPDQVDSDYGLLITQNLCKISGTGSLVRQ